MFESEMKERLNAFNLQVAPEKTKCIKFGRYARQDARNRGKKPDEFTDLRLSSSISTNSLADSF